MCLDKAGAISQSYTKKLMKEAAVCCFHGMDTEETPNLNRNIIKRVIIDEG